MSGASMPLTLGPELDGPEAPDVFEPAWNELVQRRLELRIDRPPGCDGVGTGVALVVRRIDVDAAKESGLVLVQHGVVERLARRDLVLVVLQILLVLFVAHGLRRPAPSLAVLRPQLLAHAHDRGEVDVHIRFADAAHVVTGGQLRAFRHLEIVAQPAHETSRSSALNSSTKPSN